MTSLAERLGECRILPVVTCSDVDTALRLARALVDAGMGAVEFTLRTPKALQCLAQVKERFPQLLVAAGTVTTPENMASALDAGADFCVSPGISADLLNAAESLGAQFLPGVATASEVMLGLEHGCELFKLFPAEAIGGVSLLNSLAGPFPDIRFCPTGGLTPDNVGDYLALPNVICCGGSWMVATELIANEEWRQIKRLAADALVIS
jgi:2-dehydro-3-deoxyphosphogluconate aldolase/(4S)-4-hydroxy-2-oxoglutarate aldolase